MKLSCLPVTYFADIRSGKMPMQDWLDFAVSLGVDATECSLAFIEPLGPLTTEEFKRLVDPTGLAVSAITCHSDFCHPDQGKRDEQVEDMKRNVRTAHFLGAPLVRTLTGQQHPGLVRELGITWVVEGIKRVLDEADRLGVTLVLENHTKSFFWSYFDFADQPDVFLEILRRLDGTSLRVQYDTANPLVVKTDPIALFEAVKDRIGSIHLNDSPVTGEFNFCAVGQGIAPIKEIFRRLRASGYDGWLSIEEASKTGQLGFQQAVEFTRREWDLAAPKS